MWAVWGYFRIGACSTKVHQMPYFEKSATLHFAFNEDKPTQSCLATLNPLVFFSNQGGHYRVVWSSMKSLLAVAKLSFKLSFNGSCSKVGLIWWLDQINCLLPSLHTSHLNNIGFQLEKVTRPWPGVFRPTKRCITVQCKVPLLKQPTTQPTALKVPVHRGHLNV